jgi:hypothetical protein
LNNKTCSYEYSIIHASRTGQWNEDLQAHGSLCKNCAEAIQVSRWMASLVQTLGDAGPIPDPHLIWFKSQLAEQQRLELRLLRSAIVRQAGIMSVLLLAFFALVLWIWPVTAIFSARHLLWLPYVLGLIGKPLAYRMTPILILLGFGLGFLLMPRWRKILGF